MSKTMDRILGGALIALIAVALLGGLYEAVHGEQLNTQGLLAKGTPAPPWFALRHVDHSPVKSADLGGKVVVLDFWGTWCPPCRAEAPVIAALNRGYAGKDVAFFAFDEEEGDPNPVPLVEEFLQKQHLADYPVAYPEPSIFQRYGVTHFPTLYVIGKDGTVRFRAVGAISESRLREEIDAALKG